MRREQKSMRRERKLMRRIREEEVSKWHYATISDIMDRLRIQEFIHFDPSHVVNAVYFICRHYYRYYTFLLGSVHCEYICYNRLVSHQKVFHESIKEELLYESI